MHIKHWGDPPWDACQLDSLFQHEVATAGTITIHDDIAVNGKNEKDHDANLLNIMAFYMLDYG